MSVHAKLRRLRLAEVGHLYAPALPGGRCVYCGGPGDCLDHVPGVAVLCRMSDDERAACRPQLHRSCRYCNRLLRECSSMGLDERRAFVREGRRADLARQGARAAAPGPRPGPSARARPDRPKLVGVGKGRGPGTRIRTLVEVGNWRVCLGGFSNTYVVWNRPRARSPWRRLFCCAWLPELERKLWLAGVEGLGVAPAAFVAAVSGLPDCAREASKAAARRAAASSSQDNS